MPDNPDQPPQEGNLLEREPKHKQELQTPRMWDVILLNDDYTTMEFVATIILRLFQKTQEEAIALTEEVHTKGKAVVGTYTHEIAETKACMVMAVAQENEFPLQADIQPRT